MKDKKILTQYENLKSKGVMSVAKNNHGEMVVVVKKFNEDTGEVEKTETIPVTREWIDEQKTKAQNEALAYTALESDFIKAEKLKPAGTTKKVTNS